MNKYIPLLLILAFSLSLHADDKVVKASSFGFDATESTAALQAAINSGAQKVIVENMGKPWIVDQIQLASDQEIVFEKGVVVQAKRGAFKKPKDALFSATLQSNIRLIGHGATLKMWKEDYDDPEQYSHAEWRHVLNFHSCANVHIEGLTLADSGGDGIYLGVAKRGVPCSDFVIKNVICDNNYRQGISVISARNLLIEDTVLKNTSGTNPRAGIDFEPNSPTEELSNCIMRNCVSEGNEGSGYVYYLKNMNASSKPLSIRMENCVSKGNSNSFSFTTNSESDKSGVKGSVEIVDCKFEGGRSGGIQILDKPVNGADILFERCHVIQPAPEKPLITPIAFTNKVNANVELGNVRFKDCVIEDSIERKVISFIDLSGGFALRDISGNLKVNGVEQEITPGMLPGSDLKGIPSYPLEGIQFEPVAARDSYEDSTRNLARQRRVGEWLLWAKAGDEVPFTLHVQAVGKGDSGPIHVRITSPSGKQQKLKDTTGAGAKEYSFTAEETGAYRILCDQKKWSATLRAKAHPVCLYAPDERFRLIRTMGEYFFWVPAGTKEFGVRVAGENVGERVKAGLYDPEGKLVEEKDDIAETVQFTTKPRQSDKGEIWSIRLAKPSSTYMEDFIVRLLGVPPVLAPSKEALLRPVGHGK